MPSGSSSVFSETLTPLVSSSLVLAAAMTSSGVPELLPPDFFSSSLHPLNMTAATRMSADSRLSMSSALHKACEAESDGTRHRRDRLAARSARAVALADGLGQVDRGAARGRGPGGRVTRPRGHQQRPRP